MAHWVNKDQWRSDFGRCQGKNQVGFQGDRVNVTAYTAYGCLWASESTVLPNGAHQPQYDVPNMSFASVIRSSGSGAFPAARNKAYARFIDKARNEPGSLGEDIAEWRQSFGMMEQRLLQVARAANSLRRGEFRRFLKELKVKPKSKDRNRVTNLVSHAADHWLEYSFGWSPLFQDIYDAARIVSTPLDAKRASGSGKESYQKPNTPAPNNTWEWFSTQAKVRCGGFVWISNPNTFLWQQLGLANPVQTAWNVIPFSFVADWIFDVNSFLGSFTDLLGCGVENTFTVCTAKAVVHTSWWYNFAPVTTKTRNGYQYAVKRVAGLPTPLPNFSVLVNIGHSLKRAANAASLAGQILTKMKH